VRDGDIVWFEPGERHWHGASADHAMTHVAIQQAQDGTPVTWLEHVEDTDYHG
jgi:quercetin dioxygenase-like cupin family protein